jgi:hypothetical protein
VTEGCNEARNSYTASAAVRYRRECGFAGEWRSYAVAAVER